MGIGPINFKLVFAFDSRSASLPRRLGSENFIVIVLAFTIRLEIIDLFLSLEIDVSILDRTMQSAITYPSGRG
jgi:hypothetical protein